ncbi:hypothetical protein NNJEOMEG_02562 [Fundidesulfovibrio magnetotacticus]|uniref:Bacterial membrane protein YfhO n=1 Tax=Fundidesulfovibrio magnetotacticus TaxID=2730080 RepID=A0A6V8M2Q2_9BACT|nr:hypothetical protein [Fundidesulfovibrio magnetotacticus]GFK94715.1 hypothetical protein NNJEOMEG_02562 [Fundidesulfovibrio magnetotacticus]
MTRSSRADILGLLAVLACVAAFYLASYRHILEAPGHVYQNWDQTIPPFPDEIRAYGSISRQAWSPLFEMGSPGTFNGISRAFDLIMRESLAFLGGPLLARWHFLLYALAGAAGWWLLCRRMGLGRWPALAACLLSQFNPRTYSLAVSGHGFEVGFSLALAPWAVFCADKARSARGAAFAAWSLACGMTAALAFSGSPMGLALTAAFLGLWLAGSLAVTCRPRPLAALALAGAVIVATQAHWVLPMAGLGSAGAKYNQSFDDVKAHYLHLYKDFSSPPRQALLGHTDNLGMGTEQAYPVEGPYAPWWEASATALLAFALLGLTARARAPSLKWFAAVCLLTGFWMTAGANTLPGRVLYEGLLARVQMVFFLMARPMRWLSLYQAGLAVLVGLGLQAVADRGFWRLHRWPAPLAGALCLLALAGYLWPWWSGALAVPRNETTQTMALMPQPLPESERKLAAKIAADPGDWRLTVFPTVSGPTGDVPAPPATSLTRNFGMLGKDSLVGPAFVGQPFGRFLLSLAHRPYPWTDAYGRLLGLGAVRRVFLDRNVPHLSYDDFGWMPRVKRGSETLADPGDSLERFLAAQRDLSPDPDWSAPPFLTLDNRDYLPRLRFVRSSLLAAGGLPLLAALAETPGNLFADAALFSGTDLDAAQAEALPGKAGLAVLGDGWPELLLPWLDAQAWKPASAGSSPAPGGWTRLDERWRLAPWLDASPLDRAALLALGPAALEIPLDGRGAHRILARVAALPDGHAPGAELDGRLLVSPGDPEPLDRGWRWLDLGVHQLGGSSVLRLAARGPGALVAGVLATPEESFETARRALDQAFPPDGPVLAAVQAEACALPGGAPYAPLLEAPLLGSWPGLHREMEGLRTEGFDGTGAGTLAAEGSHVGRALFRLDLPREISGFTLWCSPRLFGDTDGLAFAAAEWSPDGVSWRPLFEIAGRADGRWEDVYGRVLGLRVEEPLRALHLRFTLRQAQLNSLGNAPNRPMRLALEPAAPLGGAPSMGQAVELPARFETRPPRPGRYAVQARLLTPDGPRWADLGQRETGADGTLDLSGGPPGMACDLFLLRSGTPPDPAAPLPLETRRLNPTRYEASGIPPGGGLLLFSESWHPGWRAGEAKPLRAYGFMNAFALPPGGPESVVVDFAPQRLRDLGDRVSAAAWIASGAACLLLAGWSVFSSRRKQGRPRETP